MYRLLRAEPRSGNDGPRPAGPPTVKPELVATGTEPGVVLGHHQARRAPQMDLVPPLRDPRRLQPLRRRLARRPPRVGPPRRRAHRRAVYDQSVAAGQLTLHADRGTSMTSKTVTQLLADLGVLQSPLAGPTSPTTTPSPKPSSRPSSTARPSRNASPASTTPGPSVDRSSTTTTTTTATPASACTPPPTSTTAAPTPSEPNASSSSTPPTPPTPNDSARPPSAPRIPEATWINRPEETPLTTEAI